MFSILFSQNICAQSTNKDLNGKILIVLHMQEDSVDSPLSKAELEAISNMNKVIEQVPVENVVYVKANHKVLNLTLKKIYVSNNINDLNNELNIVNNNIFVDEGYDAFKSEELKDFIEKSAMDKLIIIGRSAEECLKKSAISGLKKGYEVYIIPNAIIGHTPEGKLKAFSKLKDKGVKELIL
jgi:nicotinamidase-related amidase